MLVVKLLQGSSKVELGLPMTEVLDRRAWLFSLYRLLYPA